MSNKLDSHKINYHPKEIADMFEGKLQAPIYVEISPTGICNHKCLFCHYNYLGHEGKFKKGKMLELVRDLASLGVKSLVFAGNGEPTLHVDTIKAIELAKSLGLDVAMSTNGALLKEEHFEVLAKNLTWIRFSFNAGSDENYAFVHQAKHSDYHKVIENIKKLKLTKDRLNSDITIGTQFVLIPENKDFALEHGTLLKSLGVDYFSVKHFYNHSHNEFEVKEEITNEFIEKLSLQADELCDDSFKFIVRSTANLSSKREYSKCYGLEFIVFIDENGDVYSCFSHQYDKKTIMGNIFENSFKDIWNSKQKKESINYINDCIEKNSCQPNCRHHQINNYLWDLKHPSIEHINFI
ncbi:MAG: radical SAM protein [Sulfurimonas sp.]|nr:radical SAM protein [Sulfurimonas sp.]MDD3834174.1 radical SAM protein [Sulfurimonas sp.]